MARHLQLDGIHPTQLYLSSEKLARVVDWFDFDDPTYEPLPAFEHERTWYLSDGHTRAVAAALAGEETLQIRRDERVRDVYDFEVYLACIEWCEDADVETVHDLIGRVVEPDSYEKRWVKRCQAVGD